MDPLIQDESKGKIDSKDLPNKSNSRFDVVSIEEQNSDLNMSSSPERVVTSKNTLSISPDNTYTNVSFNTNDEYHGNSSNHSNSGPENDTITPLPTKIDSPKSTKSKHVHMNQVELLPGMEKNRESYSRKKISTFEMLPSAAHYKNIFSFKERGGRPSLSELHGTRSVVDEEYGASAIEEKTVAAIVSEKEMGISQGPKFGWIKGVLIRCLLNIWGVMLFLRLSWMVGQAGIGLSTVIVIISDVVIVITAMSMAAICTNGEIKGGGAYYMLSRSLGPEFGGAIGIIFSMANAVSMSMNVVGLSETIVDLMQRYSGSTHGISAVNWVRIIGVLVAFLLLGIVMAGLEWETKAQMGFLVLLLASFASYFVGTFLRPSLIKRARGVIGYNSRLFRENFRPAFKGETFFSVFAIFFPSFTGFLAGCNISGDLKNAQVAIPKGTFWAIFITSLSYLLMAWAFGFTILRQATGNINDLFVNRNASSGRQNLLPTSQIILPNSALRSCTGFSTNGNGTSTCKYGLINDYQAAELQSAFGPLITIGIFAACLSSAIASLEGAAKVFQALSRDRLFPIFDYFSVGTKKHDEPFRAYFLMFFIGILFILMADLNNLAPIISNFFLMSFALINYSCFDVYMSGSIGFRPGYSYYNHWLSLIGGILCIVTMFLIKWWATLLTFFFVLFFFAYVRYKKPDVNWGSSSQAHVYKNALTWVMKLNNTEEHVKNFRPQILVLTGDPRARPGLIDFVNYFTKNLSLLICGHVILENSPEYANPPKLRDIYDFFNKRRVKALYDNIRAPNLRQGAFGLLEVAGLGRLKPNILIMGFLHNWQDEDLTDLNNYFYVIHDAFDLRFGVGIFKTPEGLDFSFYTLSTGHHGHDNPSSLYRHFHRSSNAALAIPQHEIKELSATRRFWKKIGLDFISPATDKHAPDKNANGGTVTSQVSSIRPDGDDHSNNLPVNDSPAINNFEMADIETKTTKSTNAVTNTNKKFPMRIPDSIFNRHKGHKSLPNDENNINPPNLSGFVRNGSLTIGDSNTKFNKKRGGNKKSKQQALHKKGSINYESKRLNKNIMASINRYQLAQPKGFIDIWWLFDDGGLTILLPYILAHRSHWAKCQIRFFGLCNGTDDQEMVHTNFAALLTKFRIEYSDIIILPDIQKEPDSKNVEKFDELIAKYRVRDQSDKKYAPGMITDAEYISLLNKTYRQIRLHEMLITYSTHSNLVVMTLPMPRKGSVSSSMFMAWLEFISTGMPPFFFLRGNQQSVITFYS